MSDVTACKSAVNLSSFLKKALFCCNLDCLSRGHCRVYLIYSSRSVLTWFTCHQPAKFQAYAVMILMDILADNNLQILNSANHKTWSLVLSCKQINKFLKRVQDWVLDQHPKLVGTSLGKAEKFEKGQSTTCVCRWIWCKNQLWHLLRNMYINGVDLFL